MDNTVREMQIRSRSLESNRYSNEHRKHDVGQIPSSRSFRNLRSFGSSNGILRYSNWRIHAGVARISVRRLYATIRFSPLHLYLLKRHNISLLSYFDINLCRLSAKPFTVIVFTVIVSVMRECAYVLSLESRRFLSPI